MKKREKRKKEKKKTKRKMPYVDNSYPNANEIESETLLVWQRFEGPKVQTMGKACIKAYLKRFIPFKAHNGTKSLSTQILLGYIEKHTS